MYMKNIINIHDVKRRFIQDRFGLLKDIIKSHLLKLPFQCVTSMGAIKISEHGRPCPNLRQIMSNTLQGKGGLCIYHNYFVKLQLESIGYNTQMVSGCFRRTGIPGSHSLIMVKVNPTRDSDPQPYLVDVGCGVPLHEPIPLLDLPYRARAGGLDYRYERIDEYNLQRVNEKGDAIMGEKEANYPSPQDYTINLNPTSLQTFMPVVAKVYHNPKSVFLHHGIYCYRYLHIDENDFEIVCIRGTELMFITKETRKTQTFKDYYELRPYIHKYFPMIDPMEIDQAVENYSEQAMQNQRMSN